MLPLSRPPFFPSQIALSPDVCYKRPVSLSFRGMVARVLHLHCVPLVLPVETLLLKRGTNDQQDSWGPGSEGGR
jgi:hypothetical protein